MPLNYQNILLWRHAIAEDLADFDDLDSARPLSKKGLKQADKIAHWLTSNMPKDTLILSSNALRAEQTAQALHQEYLVTASLSPSATLESALRAICDLSANRQQSENLLVVGHQPWLGLLAAQLLSFPQALPENAKEISIKKAALWWFKQSNSQENQPFKLFTVLAPSLL
jgi:phosphohistidine phosphatase